MVLSQQHIDIGFFGCQERTYARGIGALLCPTAFALNHPQRMLHRDVISVLFREANFQGFFGEEALLDLDLWADDERVGEMVSLQKPFDDGLDHQGLSASGWTAEHAQGLLNEILCAHAGKKLLIGMQRLDVEAPLRGQMGLHDHDRLLGIP